MRRLFRRTIGWLFGRRVARRHRGHPTRVAVIPVTRGVATRGAVLVGDPVLAVGVDRHGCVAAIGIHPHPVAPQTVGLHPRLGGVCALCART